MYSNKENVNILTALLVKHGIGHAVVCPGSRNAPIVHNLNECPSITCYPVTDERSAGFYALGMVQALGEPVAVCVTSGTALLNLAPAVAEAYYQHRPLVVVSADRPQQWIDQLDGQTLPQPDALGRFVRKAVTLPEVDAANPEQSWYCNRLVNEALLERHAPVHINVPISEPLFEFSVPALPEERKIELTEADTSDITLAHVCRMFLKSKRPMLIAGQPMNRHLDEAVMLVENDESYVPDLVLCCGDSIVSKRAKHYLRRAKETWAVNRTGEVNDTFMNLTQVIQGDVEVVADLVRFNLEQQPHPFVTKWQAVLQQVARQAEAYEPDYSQMAAVKLLEQQLPDDAVVHYANSTAIRLANIFGRHAVFCNRGVNGIEGSLSTAAGYSVAAPLSPLTSHLSPPTSHLSPPTSHLSPLTSHLPLVFCVIGDLSFFYDQNALWNQNLQGNFRILLLNNGRGGIFNMLKGLEQSPACDRYVAARHHTTAEGICLQNDVYYQRATTMQEMRQGIDLLLSGHFSRPMVLEVVTDAAEDERVFRDYYHRLRVTRRT